jgi:hypothetical protein
MTEQKHSTERFGDRAVAYAAFRPSYPPEAIDAVFEGLGDPSGLVVADIGSGTGISSRTFADRGAFVIGIEPNAEMRNNARVPENVEFRDGTAETTGLAPFSNFPEARVMRYAYPAVQELDLDGVLGRAASASYLANTGPESVALRRDLRKIFEQNEQSGRVKLTTVCFVITADWE